MQGLKNFLDLTWEDIKQLPGGRQQYGWHADNEQRGRDFMRVLSRKMAIMAKKAGNKISEQDKDDDEENAEANVNDAASGTVGSSGHGRLHDNSHNFCSRHPQHALTAGMRAQA